MFCNFVLTSARNPSQLKQFTYIHLKNLESRHPEVTKNPYYLLSPEWSPKNPYHLLSPEWSQKKVSAHAPAWEIKISKRILKYQHRENPQNNPRNLSQQKIAKVNSRKISDYKVFFVIT